MSVLSAVGLSTGKKIRYAIVGVGDIAQEAMMPGVAHTGNSEITALVTGDPEKVRKVGEQYHVAHTYTYEQFGEMLASDTYGKPLEQTVTIGQGRTDTFI
jgi:predicted dehydrogenase